MTGAAAVDGTWTSATVWAVFVVGLTGGFGHCIGMCGPLVAASGLASGAATARPWTWQALYHTGRIATYAVAGAALGAVGSLGAVRGMIGPVQRWAWLAAGVAMVVLGLGSAGVPLLRRVAAGAESGLARALDAAGRLTAGRLADAARRGGVAAALPLGMLNGLVPCGLLLGVQLTAVSAGSAPAGALTLLAFGIGTLPALAGLTALTGWLSARARLGLVVTGGVVVAVLGAATVVRAVGVLASVPR